ncbi:Hypothetical_protein [Hexamita inflata]|uniref:Hypothetical_protein n=1 Tax=Hexamita inflata TaxID=28002 RepID=A0AA86N937_9EUKA|nr:Hypothetical protein HINF_LOCUS2735 [Hexamita inflata]
MNPAFIVHKEIDIGIGQVEKRIVEFNLLAYSRKSAIRHISKQFNEFILLNQIQTKYVGLLEQKFEVFKKKFNKVLKSVRFRSNEINSTQFASWQSAFIFSDSSFVTYHVNIFLGFLLELFWLAPFRVTGQTSPQLKRMQQIILFAEKKIYWNTNSTPNLKKLETLTRHLNQNQIQKFKLLVVKI